MKKNIILILCAAVLWEFINILLSGVTWQIGFPTSYLNLFFLFIIFYIVGKKQGSSFQYFNRNLKLTKRIPEVIAAYGWQELIFFVCIIGLGLIFLLMQNFPELSTKDVPISPTAFSLFLSLLQTACLTPIVEEFVFRGVIYDMTILYSRRKALLFNVLLFGILHMSSINIISAFVRGIALFELREKNNDIISCIMLHMLINGLAVLQVNGYINGYFIAIAASLYYLYSVYRWYRKKDKSPAAKKNLCVKY